MEHEKVVINSEEKWGFGYGDKEPKNQTIWTLTPLKDIIRKNVLQKISDCFWKIYDYRSLYLDWIKYEESPLTPKNAEKVKLMKKFAMQCEHAYAIREQRLKEEFKEEYENRYML